ncbi:GNAT family N-acetyltransferase [Luteococcus sp. H138]|uniref:GNAT family N-acetyltransferase n=1 Tax=unclassified Luteococcus TaxID=2639923 RepID=UPI00313CB777
MHHAEPAPHRVSIRRVGADGEARDLVGDLVRADEQALVLLPAGRGPVTVPREEIRALRKVPPRVVRPSSGVDDLQRLMALGWPGVQVVRMGGWSLHVGDGLSRRANSCLPTGNPERELGRAVDDVAGFYRDRGLRPCFQLAARSWAVDEPGTALDDALAERGWTVAEPSQALVRDLRSAQPESPNTLEGLQWAGHPSKDWLAVEPSSAARERVATVVPAHYATLRRAGAVIAAGRLVLTQDWAGLSCLAVTPHLRGRGHGRALTIGLMARARELGARFCYLQVADHNDSARGLYQSLGFVEHHRYHYRERVS